MSSTADDFVDRMVDAFLAWPLPPDFQPDGGIAFAGPSQFGPVGTNLLTATQARAMLAHLAAAAGLDATLAEREMWRSHSVILNRVSWQLGDALGNIPAGAHRRFADVEDELPEVVRLVRAARAAGL